MSDKNEATKPIYAGTYALDGKTLTRASDGRQLLLCHRTDTNSRKSPVFLVDITSPGRHYVSSVYGEEIEHGGWRYGLVQDGEEVHITPLYRRGCRSRSKARAA